VGLYIKYNQSAVTGLIVLNVAIFAVLRIAGSWWPLVECPSGIGAALLRPWTVVSYMFVHREFIHLLFNMIWLWAFGDIFMTLGSRRQLVGVYVAGGISGALAYLLWCGVTHSGGSLMGASAAVIAVVVASAWRTPNMELQLVLLGEVKVKWIAVAMVALSLLNGSDGATLAAHAGGLALGTGWGLWMTRGYRQPALRFPSHKAPLESRDLDLDTILDKIRRSGYKSLTAAERTALLQHSKRL
jgi:membrane associated rhomboid family serine protease